MEQARTVADGSIQAQSVIPLQGDWPEPDHQIESESNREPKGRKRTGGELARGEHREAEEADQVERLVPTRPSLISAERLKTGSHPVPFRVMAAKPLHNQVASRRCVALDYAHT